ncbi:MAG: hypothetical protein ACFCD0_23340 [Gemmataceae bacterium]
MAGEAIKQLVHLMALIGTGLFGLLGFAYGAYCLVVILEQTAAGNRDIVWPDEPFTDWLGKGVYLGWVLLLCAIPGSLLGLPLGGMVTSLTLGKVLLVLGSVWLLLPLVLLSSLSAQSMFAVINPQFLRRAIYHFGPLMLFYGLSAIVWVFTVTICFVAQARSLVWLIFLAPLVGAAGVFLFGRLLGRFAWLVTNQPPPSKKLKTTRKPRGREPDHSEESDDEDWGIPQSDIPDGDDSEEDLEDEAETKTGSGHGLEPGENEESQSRPTPYALEPDNPPQTQTIRKESQVGAVGTYALEPEEDSTEPLPAFAPETLPDQNIQSGLKGDVEDEAPTEVMERYFGGFDDSLSEQNLSREKKTSGRRKKKRRLHVKEVSLWRLFGTGVYELPWTPTCLRAWLGLSLWCLLLNLAVWVLLSTWPTDS